MNLIDVAKQVQVRFEIARRNTELGPQGGICSHVPSHLDRYPVDCGQRPTIDLRAQIFERVSRQCPTGVALAKWVVQEMTDHGQYEAARAQDVGKNRLHSCPCAPPTIISLRGVNARRGKYVAPKLARQSATYPVAAGEMNSCAIALTMRPAVRVSTTPSAASGYIHHRYQVGGRALRKS